MKLLKNKVTRNAILYTLLMLFIYRVGSFIVTPLIDSNSLFSLLSSATSGTNSLTNLFNFMGGGSLNNMALFALGVSPYITASIVIQLLENDIIPSVAEWKHQGVDGQNKRANWTKYLAIIFAFVQAVGITFGFYQYQLISQASGKPILRAIPFADGSKVGIIEYLVIGLFITAGTAILMWIADRITEKGIGNGMSVIIMAGILSRIPKEFLAIYNQLKTASSDWTVFNKDFWIDTIVWTSMGFLTLLLIIAVVIYTLTERKIKINYVKSYNGSASENSYIPLRLNPAGVIPIIFVIPLMAVPGLIKSIPAVSSFFSRNGQGWLENILFVPFDLSSTTNYWPIAVIVYFILVVGFSIMYSYIQMNPEQMAENLEKQSAYIAGIRPGEETINYLTKVLMRTTIYGGSFLAILAVLPIIIQKAFPSNLGSVKLQLIGTGLIITVNVLVQTHQAMTNKVESKTYKKLF